MVQLHREGVQGICVTGWHIPSDGDWTTLEGAVGNQPRHETSVRRW
ncbi:hypothetical protein [Abyssogena phaseoliformis symbiont]|nr:hypothetical protein [Abyssogena phaseoliformis symbiont]